jgi:hypothetical protein
VATFPAPTEGTNTIATALTLTSGKFFNVFDFTEDTGGLKEESVGTVDAMSIKTTGTFKIPQVMPSKKFLLNSLNNARLCIILQDGHGNNWLLGDKTRPARLKATADIGTKYEDANGFTVEVSWASQLGAYAYTPNPSDLLAD